MRRRAVYSRSAQFYDALNRGKDYKAASDAIVRVVKRLAPDATTLLDVGCGTGRHLESLRRRFRVEGVDASRAMLEIARRRCPRVPLQHGSVLDLRLGRQFDVVTCLFGSIAYASTIGSLTKAVKSLARHLEPNGLLVVEPWVAPARFISKALVCDTADDTDFKVARMYVTRRQGRRAILDVHYLVARRQGVTNFVERHELGLHSDDDYRRAFHAAGLVLLTTSDLFGYGAYVCRKPSVTRKDSARRRPA